MLMPMEYDIRFNSSYYKKTNSETLKKCIEETVKKVTLECENNCKKECPVDTGLLQKSHSTRLNGDTGEVANNCGYAEFVVYGTYKMAPNNYPARVLKELAGKKFASQTLHGELQKEGML